MRNGAEPVHTKWKCWGFRCLAPTMTGAFTWESASRTLCMQRKPEFSTCHAAIDNKFAERLSQVYFVVIRRRNRENTEPRDGKPGRFLKGERKRNGGKRLPDTLGAR